MNIAINGFGRIGRSALRTLIDRSAPLNIVAINDLTDIHTLAHLLKYDSVHGPFQGDINIAGSNLIINGQSIVVCSEHDPSKLPWKDANIDVVVESSGRFTDTAAARQHLLAGSKQVVISAPSPDKLVPTIIMGVNDHQVDLSLPILSNASCTTNNVAPLIKILDQHWGIENGYITTVHSMTGDQNLHDAPHKDLRRARAASSSIIPTSTGAAKAVTQVFPHLEGKLGGAGIRVPVLNGSLTDFTCILTNHTNVQAINKAFLEASLTDLHGILQYTEDPIVSVDIINSPYSCVFDASLTSIVGGLVKVVGWYDNEFGYANRLTDLLLKLAHKTPYFDNQV